MLKRMCISLKRVSAKFVLFLITINILLFNLVIQHPNDNLKIYFFDVGQGDSILIVTPDKYSILVDAGPDNTVLSRLGETMLFWDRRIDLAILTHPDADHVGGFPEVLKYYDVNAVLFTGIQTDNEFYEEFQRYVSNQSIQKLNLSSTKYRIGCCVYVNLLWPPENIDTLNENVNNTSISFELIYKNTNIFFGGDLESKYEDQLINVDSWLDVDVLKVSHHGSKLSTSADFVQKISPEVAVISVGKDNKYNHPNDEVVERLTHENVQVLRTDENGTIKCESDGDKFIFK